MSQSLALVLPVQNADPESSLALAFQGHLVAADISECCFADEDEAGDVHGIVANVPRLSANAKEATFHDPSMEELARKKAPDTMEGIILARRESNIHFPPKDDKGKDAKAFGYTSLLGDATGPKWLCRNNDLARPDQAELNPQLSSVQVEEAKRLGIGGATHTGCSVCSAGAYRRIEEDGKTRNVRLCTRSESLIWLDSKAKEPVVIQVQAASSTTELRNWISKVFVKGRRSLSLFSFVVKLGWRNEMLNGRKTNILTPEQVVPLGDPAQMELLRAARKSLMWMLDKAAESTDSYMPHLDEQEAAPTAADLNLSAEELQGFDL